MIQAGFYETDITPAIGMERPAVYHKLFHSTIHDPLKVRACVLDDGAEKIAIIGVDTCVIGDNTVQKAREAIVAKCEINEQNILIAASHTHSGGPLFGVSEEDVKDAPEFIKKLALEESTSLNSAYENHVINQLVTAVTMADQCKQDAKLSIGNGIEDKAAFNRCFKLKHGRIATHPGKGSADIVEPAGPIDPEVGVIAAWDGDEQLLGCIVNYACHTTCSGQIGISADWVYYLEKTIQGVMGEQANVVFLNGACGDITQVDNQSLREREFGEKWSKHVGTRVGAEALKVLVTAEKTELAKLAVLSEALTLKVRKPAAESIIKSRELCENGLASDEKPEGFAFAKERILLDYLYSPLYERKVEVQAIQIGAAVLLANPAEYFCQLGLDIKKESNFPYTFVVELANGCCGYVPTEDAFDPDHGGGYETVLTSHSNLEVAAGRKIKECSVKLANQLIPDAVPVGEQVEPVAQPWNDAGPELD